MQITYEQKPGIKRVKTILFIILIIGMVASSSVVIYLHTIGNKKDNTVLPPDDARPVVNKTTTPTEPPKPKFLASPVNGVMIEEKEFNKIKDRPVLAVMIQNHTLSRPQWGLNKADVVYEALAEGGITRFMGIFWSQDAGKLMSIRSARKYYVDLLGDYKNPVYMHEGYASGDESVSAIDAMNKYGVRSLGLAGGSLLRDHTCEKTKAIEHCAYTDTSLLWENAEKKNWKGDITALETWKYKDADDSVLSLDSARDLTDFSVSFGSLESSFYDTRWKYDAVGEKYLRFNPNNTPFMDGENKQITSDVVIYQKINTVAAGDYKNHVVQDVIGNGTGYIMQDGKVFPITWKKPNYATKTRYYDAVSGAEFVFNRGRIWVMEVPKTLEYKDNAPKLTTTATSVSHP